jgi:hypothetical protein
MVFDLPLPVVTVSKPVLGAIEPLKPLDPLASLSLRPLLIARVKSFVCVVSTINRFAGSEVAAGGLVHGESTIWLVLVNAAVNRPLPTGCTQWTEAPDAFVRLIQPSSSPLLP